MAGKKDLEKREKADKRHLRVWRIVVPVTGIWMRKKFNYSFEDFEPADIEGPVIAVINHSNAFDPVLLASAFRNKPLAFVASEHLLRMRPWGPVLNYLGSMIPHTKGAKGRKTALVAIKKIKRGESVFLAAEGEQTWNGLSVDVMPYTGKLVKGSGASLVTYKLEGAYLSYPRWARYPRKGRIYGHPVNVYTPEVLAGMTDSEIESAINEDIRDDSAKWQKEQSGGPVRYVCKKGGNAEGLERAVCACPECGRIGGLVSLGDDISCSCGFSARLTDTGFFEKGAPFEYTAEWEEYDRKKIAELLDEKETGTLFSDERVTLRRVNTDHTDEILGKGRLELGYNGSEHMLSAPGMSFALKDIRDMTMVLANRIVFSDAGGYYELKADKSGSTNLRKYVITWGLERVK